MKALHIAPGLHRRFAAERYAFVPAGTFQRARADALEQVVRDAPFEAVGFDIDGDAVALAAHNAKLAGVASHVRFYRADVKDFARARAALCLQTRPMASAWAMPERPPRWSARWASAWRRAA